MSSVAHFKKAFKKELTKDDVVIVSPDAGGVARAQSYAKRLMRSADLAIIHKEREIPNQVARMKLIGDVTGKVALIIDDMADTCGTLARAAELLKEHGATAVYAATTHGILSGEASAKLDASPLQKLFITDSIQHNRPLSKKVEVVSVANLFADAIARISRGRSLSELFEA
jgi:ribose-phosphate pyrophosphokinase